MTDIMDIILTWQVPALKAAGFQVTPIEPTKEMIEAALNNLPKGTQHKMFHRCIISDYKVMNAAWEQEASAPQEKDGKSDASSGLKD